MPSWRSPGCRTPGSYLAAARLRGNGSSAWPGAFSRLVVEEARRMSRRNTRQGKARRRGERDRRQVTERERKRPRIPAQDAQADADQAVQAAPPPAGSGPRNSDEQDSGSRSDVGGSLTAVDPGEAD